MPCPTVTKSSSHMLISMIRRDCKLNPRPYKHVAVFVCLFVCLFVLKIRNLTFNNFNSPLLLANEYWRYWSVICFERYECTKTWCFTHIWMCSPIHQEAHQIWGLQHLAMECWPRNSRAPRYERDCYFGAPRFESLEIPNHRASNHQICHESMDFHRVFC